MPRQLIRSQGRKIAFVLLLVVLTLSLAAKSTDKDEGLRAQLASLQNEVGLGLRFFGWSVGTVDFAHRKVNYEEVPGPAARSQNGDLSPHGTMVAFSWFYSTDPFVSRLAIVQKDGRGLREFPVIKGPKYFCWSPDEAKLAVYSFLQNGTSAEGRVFVVHLHSNQVEEIATGPAFLTPQCWSPDGYSLVYGITALGDEPRAVGKVALYSFADKTTKILASGAYPTWSSDGNSIAFLDGEDYYVIRASGNERKLFLHAAKPRTGLLWSPDGRFIAYGLCCKYDLSTTLWRFYVRRLRDNAEDWVADIGDIPHGRDVHWVETLRIKEQ